MKVAIASIVGASALAIGAFTAGDLTSGSSSTTTVAATTLAEGQYVGPCSTVTPPEPDPCEATQLVIWYQLFGALVNTAYFAKWKTANPGELTRLGAVMAAPKCSTALSPQPQVFLTFYGAMLADAVEAYACALGKDPIAMPAPNPPPKAGSTDKTAPKPPGALQVTPSGSGTG